MELISPGIVSTVGIWRGSELGLKPEEMEGR